jgi:uncharacterized membrane protein YidH (DUF202 family)
MTEPEPTPYASTPAPSYAAPAPWNVLSIVSLVTSVIGLSIVGIITGHISLSQIKRTGEQGRVLAIIGLVLGYVYIVVFVIVFFAVLIPLIFVAANSGYNY